MVDDRVTMRGRGENPDYGSRLDPQPNYTPPQQDYKANAHFEAQRFVVDARGESAAYAEFEQYQPSERALLLAYIPSVTGSAYRLVEMAAPRTARGAQQVPNQTTRDLPRGGSEIDGRR